MMNRKIGFMITIASIAIASTPPAIPDPFLDPILDEVECFGAHSRVVTSTQLTPAAPSPDDDNSGVMRDTFTGAQGVFIYVDGSNGHSYDFTGVIKKYVRCDGYKPEEPTGLPTLPA